MQMKAFYKIFALIVLSLPCCHVCAQGVMPKGELTLFDYYTTYQKGSFVGSFARAVLQDNQRVAISTYDYYADRDSFTVYGDTTVIHHIRDIIASSMKSRDLRGEVKWLNGEVGIGQTHYFTAIFDSGDTLRMKGYIANYGMESIARYLREISDSLLRIEPIQELELPVPKAAIWHNGYYYGDIDRLAGSKNKEVSRWKLTGREILVMRDPDSHQLVDVYVRAKNKNTVGAEMLEAHLDIFRGVYENEKGYSVFGPVSLQLGESYYGDPTGKIQFDCKFYTDHMEVSDVMKWGAGRILRSSGGVSGSSVWKVRFVMQGLQVEEIEAAFGCPTYPAFGKLFFLKRVRGPLRYDKRPWSIVLDQPLTRGVLNRLGKQQLKEILDDIEARHSDGSPMYDVERLNKELVTVLLAERP